MDYSIDEWHPYFDGAIEYIKNIEEMSQQGMNRNSGSLAYLFDAKLYFLYYKYISDCDEKTKNKIRNEQIQWMKKRKNFCEDQARGNIGGTIYPLIYAEAFCDITKDRIKFFEELIDDEKKYR